MITLPGLIDIHVHLRTPGQEHKEDFYTGTSAALAGGFTTILDMPNNKVPITTHELLQQKIDIAQKEVVADLGFHFGSLGDNLDEFSKVKSQVFGIKLYLNITTGNFLIDEEKLTKIYEAWNSPQPIILHCEGETMPMALKVIRATQKRTHIAHVSSKEELSQIIYAKEEGLPITCGVTPHHLFLTEEEAKKLGPYGHMKPYLKTWEDVAFLWTNLSFIDLIESDHAPHTKEEKEGETPPFGVPGLETTVPLLLTAVSEGKMSMDDVIRLCYASPKRIFNIPTDESTYIQLDENEVGEIKNKNLKTKSGWSPFNDKKIRGKVKKVFIRGKKVFEDGEVLAEKGSGKVISPVV